MRERKRQHPVHLTKPATSVRDESSNASAYPRRTRALYVFVERRDEKVVDACGTRTVRREAVNFPRYDQVDALGRLRSRLRRPTGLGRKYFDPGTRRAVCKTNSISWLVAPAPELAQRQ